MRARVWGIAVYTVHDNTVILTVCNGSFMIGHDRRACRKQVGGDIPNIDLKKMIERYKLSVLIYMFKSVII